MSQDLRFLPATQAAALIAAKKLSPVEYVKPMLAAIEGTQRTLNAYVTVTAEAALAEAKAAEAAVMRGERLPPLHGVPVSIKDLIETAGIRTTHGSHVHADLVPNRDDLQVQRLKAAGAIIVGKTTTPEFGHKGMTDSPLTGITRNPWNTAHSSGGSSGGAAVAVAAGLGPLALGTDGAGSIRGPAACCGIFGLKPTRGAVPHPAARDLIANMSFAGPMTRTVGDAALMFDALIGPDDSDPWSAGGQPRPLASRLMAGRLDGVRIGYIEKMANPEIDAQVREATLDALRKLESLGARVEPVTAAVDWIEPAGRILYMGGIWTTTQPLLEKWRDKLDPSLVGFAELGRPHTLADFRNAEFARTGLYRAVQALFDRYDLLVSPTMAATALKAEFDVVKDQVMVNGKPCGLTRQGLNAYQYPFNLTGHPAVSLPNGFDKLGLPIGLQIVGRWRGDWDLLRVSAMFEQAKPWAQHRPGVVGPAAA